MKVSNHTVVTVSYHLQTPEEGALVSVEQVTADNPAVFLVGVGQLLPSFESNLEGKQAGDDFAFVLSAEDAYGAYFNERIVDLPLDIFQDEQGKIDMEMLKPGSFLPMRDSEGNRLLGRVINTTLEVVRMDFNHPLAGKELNFSGKVLEVRAATTDEISHGHVHGPGGHHH